jgi:hypothetical protein
MTRFTDDLYDDLMREHGAALRGTHLPAAGNSRGLRRAAVLGGGAVALVGALTAGVALSAGTAGEAFAVTPGPGGTVTVSLSDITGVTGANSRLHALGITNIIVVPVSATCQPPPPGAGRLGTALILGSQGGPATYNSPIVTARVQAGPDEARGSITVNEKRLPAWRLIVLAAAVTTTRSGVTSVIMTASFTTPPAPACYVTIPRLPSSVRESHGG